MYGGIFPTGCKYSRYLISRISVSNASELSEKRNRPIAKAHHVVLKRLKKGLHRAKAQEAITQTLI